MHLNRFYKTNEFGKLFNSITRYIYYVKEIEQNFPIKLIASYGNLTGRIIIYPKVITMGFYKYLLLKDKHILW